MIIKNSQLLKNIYELIFCKKLHYDVIIAGGGVMGASTAFFLKSKEQSLKIGVIEKDSTYTKASSVLSAGSIRQQFSCAENVFLSRWSRNFLQDVLTILQVSGHTAPDIQFFQSSYMFLASCDKGVNIMETNTRTQRECGADTQVMSPDQLYDKYPWLNIDGIAAGSLCNDDVEGWFDGWMFLQSLRKKCISLGVDFIDGECKQLQVSSKVYSVQSSHNGVDQTISCGNFLNAAGPWAGQLMSHLGIDLPVCPRKRYVYVFDCPKGPGRLMPLTVDPTGVYCRPEGRGTMYLSGCSPEEDEEPDPSDLEVDYDYFYEFIWPVLANRYPAMEELKLKHSWSGFYDFNTFDQNAIIGAHNEIANLFFANGFSGHGIQQSPAVGNAVSDIILYGKFDEFDLRRFRFGRIAENQPTKEVNVV